jgi:hypothetical protein
VTVETASDSALLAFGVTAKVTDQTAHGDGGLDLRDGLRHFTAGAMAWVLPPQWGDGGEKVLVAGRHRGSRGRGYARIVVNRRHLTGFRARGIYSPAPLAALTRPLRDGSSNGAAAGAFLAGFVVLPQPSVNPAPSGSPTHVTRDRDPRGDGWVAPLWWTDGVGQADPGHLRLRRT